MKKKSLAEIRRTEEYENLRLALNEPNIFNILKIEEREIRHSNFLAWLLDPKESHGLNEYFLKWFLYEHSKIYEEYETVEGNFLPPNLLDKLNWQFFHVYREETITHREVPSKKKYIDIFVTYNPENRPEESFTLTIENKIRAKDSRGQLQDYFDAVKRKKWKLGHPVKSTANYFVYLTPEGDAPLDEKMAEKYIPLGYDVIYKKLKWIFDIKKDWISEKSAYYINDYLENLEIKILNCNENVQQLSEKLITALPSSQNIEDEIIKYAKEHCDLNKNLKELVERKGFEMLEKECSRERIRFLPKQLPEMLEKFRVENEKDNGVDNRHLPNYSLIVFELKIERNDDGSNHVRLNVTIAPSKYHVELRECIDKDLKMRDSESKINTMHKGANRWHSVLKTEPYGENKSENELEGYVESLLFEKKAVLDIITDSVKKWAEKTEI